MLFIENNGLIPILATSSAAADPQLQFFENFPGHQHAGNGAYSNGTMSIHVVQLDGSVSFRYPMLMISRPNSGGSHTIQFGLYSDNAGTLSLANSASKAFNFSNAFSWISLATSATQNITPGTWYFALNILSAGTSNLSFMQNQVINPVNAQPFFIMGRRTVSTNAIPTTLATSDLDITGSDAFVQPYILITT